MVARVINTAETRSKSGALLSIITKSKKVDFTDVLEDSDSDSHFKTRKMPVDKIKIYFCLNPINPKIKRVS